MPAHSPFIVTLLLDERSSAFFNTLRQRYFPPDKNYLQAHLTLFHHLPFDGPTVQQNLKRWAEEMPALQLAVTEVKNIGKGIAYKVECAALMKLHKEMQLAWQQWLTPQDRQKLWPHVTVQNKVTPATAKETLQVLQQAFQPFTAQGFGFLLWHYEGGPWRFVAEHRFAQG